MKTTYTRTQGLGLTYDIEADRHGGYTISLAGKTLKHSPALQNYFGKSKWGSKAQEAHAVKAAHAAIEMLMGMPEQ